MDRRLRSQEARSQGIKCVPGIAGALNQSGDLGEQLGPLSPSTGGQSVGHKV